MKEYVVHFMGYYGYDVKVKAESEEEARAKAEPIFEDVSANDYTFVPDGVDIWEA